MRSALCALLLALVACSASVLPVEHSLDGGQSWSKAGDLTLALARRGSSAVLDRAPLTAEQQSALNKLAAGGGLYRLRLPSAGGGSPPVAASFPVYCLAASASDGGLALDLLDGGHVAGIALNAPCGQRIAAELQLPASQAVAVRLPTAAPEVLPQLVPGQVAGDATAGLGGVGLQQDAAGGAAGAAGAAGQQAAGEGRGTGQQGGGKGKPQPDERTWLQKNWMLVMPLGFIVLNILGNAAGPQGQQRPGAGGAPARPAGSQR